MNAVCQPGKTAFRKILLVWGATIGVSFPAFAQSNDPEVVGPRYGTSAREFRAYQEKVEAERQIERDAAKAQFIAQSREFQALLSEKDDELRDAIGRLNVVTEALSDSSEQSERRATQVLNLQYAVIDLVRLAARTDPSIGAYFSVVDRGIDSFFSSNNPDVRTALDRLQRGDFNVLTTLAEFTRLEHSANMEALGETDQAIRDLWEQRRSAQEARIRKSTGDRLRLIAQGYQQARAIGEATAEQSLAAWLEASNIDPEEFDQWLTIANIASSLGREDIRLSALKSATQLASGRENNARILLDLLTTDPSEAEMEIVTGLIGDADPEAYIIEAFHVRYLQNPENFYNVFPYTGAIAAVISNRLSRFEIDLISRGERNYAHLEGIDELMRRMFEANLRVKESVSLSTEDYDGGINYMALQARIALAREQLDLALQLRREIVEFTQSSYLSVIDAENEDEQQIAWYFAESHARALRELAVIEPAPSSKLSLYHDASVILRQLHHDDPGVSHYRVLLWATEFARGELELEASNFVEAEEALEGALAVGRLNIDRMEVTAPVASVLPLLAQTKLSLGKFCEAVVLYTEASEIPALMPEGRERASLRTETPRLDQLVYLKRAADVGWATQDPAIALAKYQDFLMYSETQGRNDFVLHSQYMLGLIKLIHGDEIGARNDFLSLLARTQTMTDTLGESAEANSVAQVYDLLGNFILAHFPDGEQDWMSVRESAYELSVSEYASFPDRALGMAVLQIVSARSTGAMVDDIYQEIDVTISAMLVRFLAGPQLGQAPQNLLANFAFPLATSTHTQSSFRDIGIEDWATSGDFGKLSFLAAFARGLSSLPEGSDKPLCSNNLVH